MPSAAELWTSLDPDGPPRTVWARQPDAPRVAVLMGAFDPPTNAHLAVLCAAAALERSTPVFCMTKVLLARSGDELLSRERRVEVVGAIAERLGAGLVFANRGTYLDVGRALRADGFDPSFVVGADKLAQLADPSFYPDGSDGVRATFDEVRFIVVQRGDVDLAASRHGAVARVLDQTDVFADPSTAAISATQVRRMQRRGEPVDALVPPEVVLALRGYTSAR